LLAARPDILTNPGFIYVPPYAEGASGGLASGGLYLEKLTIKARTAESAQNLYSALAGFRTAIIEAEDGWRVEVEFGRGDREIVEVLNAIERIVTDRQDGPAEIELSGREYTMHPDGGAAAHDPA
jgi:hypothetical protein